MSTRSLAGINRGQTLQEVVEAELGDLAEYENFDQVIQAVARAGANTLLAGGGVLANSVLRSGLQNACASGGIALHLADRAYCTDNAAMIAAHGYHLFQAGQVSPLNEDVYAAETNELIFAR